MAAHPVLPANPTLADVQAYVAAVVKHRGFNEEMVQDKFILLTEEVGELAKALRGISGVKTAIDSTKTEVEHEVADVLWLLMCICNKLDVDLEAALRSKEEKNKLRTWK